MAYRLISEEELEKLGLEADEYMEPVWYFTEEKARKIYSECVFDDLTEEELGNFTEYLKAFIKVSPEEVSVLDEHLVELIKNVKNMYESK